MGTLQEVAGLILLQVNHNRECGKDDKFTKDEIADIIHRRVDKKDLITDVVKSFPIPYCKCSKQEPQGMTMCINCHGEVQ